MNTDQPTIPTQATRRSTRTRLRTRWIIAIGAAAAVAVVTSSAAVQSAGDDPARSEAPPTTQSEYAELRALVDRGVVPRQALEPGPLSEARLRALVDSGAVPRQALDPAPPPNDEAQTSSTAP